MLQRILLVEDDEKLGRQIVAHLRDGGFEPTWIKDGAEALSCDAASYSLIVLDLMLPGAHGFDVLKQVRQNNDVPVLVLSARNATTDKVRALSLGADDYVTKPFWPDELVARVKARLRRPALQRADVIEAGAVSIDLVARTIRVRDRVVDLTRVEFELLAALARRPGAAISRSWLAEHVLDPDREGTERTLDVHMSRLRKKLGDCGSLVATVWGVGYRLDVTS